MFNFRVQPLRIRQSQVGMAERSEEITAWLNFNATILFQEQDGVFMTRNFCSERPNKSLTNATSDIFFYKKKCPSEPFEHVCSNTDEQSKNEKLEKCCGNQFYHVSISKSLKQLIRRVKRLPCQKRKKNIVIFIKIGETGHHFAGLYYPFDEQRLELFDAGGSSLDIDEMRRVQYKTFQKLFGVDYIKEHEKLIIVSKYGFQNSVFDEYCQTWIYFYLYMRRIHCLSVQEFNCFMKNIVDVCGTEEESLNMDEKKSLGYTGLELTNQNRKCLFLITNFRKWFLNIYKKENDGFLSFRRRW